MEQMAIFDPIKAEMEKIRAHNETVKFDYEDPKGNKEARSHIFSLRKVKSRIADAHKQAKADILEAGRVLDGLKRDLTAEVEVMIEKHDAPLREIEQREANAKAEEAARIQAEKDAEDARIREEMEAKQREIERKERELAEREEAIARAEREAQIAKEAEERARKEAERCIALEREKAEREKQEALEKMKREQEAKERAEAARVQAEKERIERERKEAEEKEAARIADKQHREIIENDILRDLQLNGLSPDWSASILNMLKNGTVRHVSINY